MKRSELISVEPEILQMTVRAGCESTHLLKVKNLTGSTISSLFFCLFNQEKFEFVPDSFNLLPREEKLVTVKLRITSDDGLKLASNKEFAYLKASQINIRITMLLKYEEEDQESSNRERYSALESSAPLAEKLEKAIREDPRQARDSREQRQSPSPTEDELHSLSSRAYLHNQATAFEKILLAKDDYIAKLETELAQKNEEDAQRQERKQTDQQAYEQELKEVNTRAHRTEAELRQLTKEHRSMESELHRIRQGEAKYHKLYEDEKRVFTDLKIEFGRAVQEKRICEEKLEEMERYLQSRDDRIRQLELLVVQLRGEIHSDNHQLVESMQSKLISQRKNFEEEFNQYEHRLKELEVIAQSSEAMRNQTARLEQDLIRKQEELKHAKSQVEMFKKSSKELEVERLQRAKLEADFSRLTQNNKVLASKVSRYEEQLEKQRHEMSAQRSRVEELRGDDRSSAYRDVALESCKSENDALKREKLQMEKMLLNYATTERFYKDRIDELQKELQQSGSMISNAMKAKRSSQDHNYNDELIRLKEENVMLLEKLQEARSSPFERGEVEAELQHFKMKAEQLERQLVIKETQLSDVHSKLDRVEHKYAKLQKEKNRYKDDLREDLNHINQAAMEEIRKLTADKKKLNKKLAELTNQVKDFGEERVESKARLDERDRIVTSTKNSKKAKDKQKQPTETNQSSPHANKLQNIETQLVLMREQLNNFKETAQQGGTRDLVQSRKSGGIHNQRREVADSRNKSQSYITPLHATGHEEQLHRELGELREIEKVIENEQRRFRSLFGVEVDDDYPGRSVLRVISLFKAIEDALRNARSHNNIIQMAHQEQLQQIENRHFGKENESRLGNLNQSQMPAPTNMNLNTSTIEEKNPKLYEYLQEEMKAQFKKLNETIQLCHEKYELLKKKVYNEYRSKLSDLLGKKDRSQLPRLEQLLEKFVEGLANTSHKEAMLSKEVRKKLELRRENEQLKGKVGELQHILQDKKGICTRDPVKILTGKRPQDYLHESVRLEAQLLTCQAENRRLLEQLGLSNDNAQSATAEFKNSINILEEKEDQILKLKSQVIEIDRVHKQEVASMLAQMDMLRAQYLKVNELEQQVLSLGQKEKECTELRRQLNRKRELIDSLKEKEKTLLQVLDRSQKNDQEGRHRTSVRDREEEVGKLQEIISELRDKSKELRGELEAREDSQRKLLDEIDKKNAYIASLKAANSRQSETPNQAQLQNVRLSTQLKQLQQRLTESKSANSKMGSTIDNLKTRISELEKQVTSLINEAKSNNSDWLIKEKSLTSIIRSAVEMLRRLWRLLQIKGKKMHPSVQQTNQFDNFVKDIYKIDMIRLYDGFEELVRELGRD